MRQPRTLSLDHLFRVVDVAAYLGALCSEGGYDMSFSHAAKLRSRLKMSCGVCAIIPSNSIYWSSYRRCGFLRAPNRRLATPRYCSVGL